MLVRRAERDGRSLQQYLTALLTRAAATPTLDEVLDHIATLRGGSVSLADAVEALAQERPEP